MDRLQSHMVPTMLDSAFRCRDMNGHSMIHNANASTPVGLHILEVELACHSQWDVQRLSACCTVHHPRGQLFHGKCMTCMWLEACGPALLLLGLLCCSLHGTRMPGHASEYPVRVSRNIHGSPVTHRPHTI